MYGLPDSAIYGTVKRINAPVRRTHNNVSHLRRAMNNYTEEHMIRLHLGRKIKRLVRGTYRLTVALYRKVRER
jgi:hypothetical protein